jgi:hypothetical protein
LIRMPEHSNSGVGDLETASTAFSLQCPRTSSKKYDNLIISSILDSLNITFHSIVSLMIPK